MEDDQIVDLYWQRNEQAIYATSAKYGRYCYRIAYQILSNQEDAGESVNDTYLKAWDCMPPHRPAVLSAFLGKITRRLNLNRWRDRSREKRGCGEIPLALDELSDCIPSGSEIERSVELRELSCSINEFLGTLPDTERDVFVCRYWFLAPVRKISRQFSFSESKTRSMLFRTRNKLKRHLEKEALL